MSGHVVPLTWSNTVVAGDYDAIIDLLAAALRDCRGVRLVPPLELLEAMAMEIPVGLELGDPHVPA